jgi:putative oxidoreductase
MNGRAASYAALLLRLVLGALFILHLYRKFFITGLPLWWHGFAQAGYPPWVLGYDLVVEAVAAVALPLGWHARWVSLAALPALLGASQYLLVRKGFWFGDAGAEFALLWSVALVVQALLGDGAWALRRR